MCSLSSTLNNTGQFPKWRFTARTAFLKIFQSKHKYFLSSLITFSFHIDCSQPGSPSSSPHSASSCSFSHASSYFPRSLFEKQSHYGLQTIHFCHVNPIISWESASSPNKAPYENSTVYLKFSIFSTANVSYSGSWVDSQPAASCCRYPWPRKSEHLETSPSFSFRMIPNFFISPSV